MRTSYGAPGFAKSYGRARALPDDMRNVWADRLREVASADAVSTVLDVGAGVGRFWPVFAAAWNPSTIIALDRSAAMLGQGADLSEVVRVVGDLDSVPLRNASVDIAFCSMSLHYSPNPASAVEQLSHVVRPGGWLCVRSGTTESLASFDFLTFFPTAIRAEARAMPSQELLESWVAGHGFDMVKVTTITAGKPASRIDALRAVLRRGFPSLQLVPRLEFAAGVAQYACWLTWTAVRRLPRPGERSVLLVARRRQ